MIDSTRKYSNIIDNSTNNETQKPFSHRSIEWRRGGPRPVRAADTTEEKTYAQTLRHALAVCLSTLYFSPLRKKKKKKILIPSALRFVEDPSKISPQIIRPEKSRHNPLSFPLAQNNHTTARPVMWCRRENFLQLFSLRWYTLYVRITQRRSFIRG